MKQKQHPNCKPVLVFNSAIDFFAYHNITVSYKKLSFLKKKTSILHTIYVFLLDFYMKVLGIVKLD